MKIKKQSSSRLLPVTLLVVAVGLLMGSCKKEPKDDGKGGLRAVMVDFAHSGQKAYIDPEHYSCFQSGENVRVNATTNQVTPLTNYKNRRCEIGEVPSADNYYAVYPAEMLVNPDVNLSSGFGGTPVAMKVPNVQTWSTDGDGNQILNNPMLSYEQEMIGDIKHLLFRNLCALWKISVSTTKDFNKIKITIPGCVMAGKGNIVMTGTGGHFPKLVVDTDTSHSVTLDLGTTHHGTAWGEGFYIVVPELTVPTGSTVYVEFLNGSTSVKKFKLTNTGDPITFEANRIHTLANFNFNVGLFSVRDGKTVVFAPGNLQWSYSALGSTHSTSTTAGNSYNRGTWRFAEHQYDVIGQGNVNAIGTHDGLNHFNNVYCGYEGWIDLFPWGGSGLGTSRPYYYTGIYYCENNNLGDYDWGNFNTIYNPQTKVNDPFGTVWYTLSDAEWHYVTKKRGNENWWRYNVVEIIDGLDTICRGLILYPDTTLLLPNGINSTLVKNDDHNFYSITKAEYDILENSGCAFFPCTGRLIPHVNGNIEWVEAEHGFYWSSSGHSENSNYFGHNLYINRWTGLNGSAPDYSPIQNTHYSSHMMAVRLAHVVKDNSSSTSD